VGPIRSLLRYLWRRKFFPLRPCRWDFSVDKPLDQRKIKSCLYYHTRECPAPCAGRIGKDDYRLIADQAALFFAGDYGELRRRFAAEMKTASAKMEYERAAKLRDNELALASMGERVRVRAVRAQDVGGAIAASRAVTELQKALGLEHPPVRIECFDISHFSGKQTVAAMVSFRGGDPDRANYRKFRIRETVGVDDFKSMHEAVLRRYRRLKAENAPLPDLVLIDGGKGQLGAALLALKEAGVKIPLASLAKRVEEVFMPGRAQSLILPLESPALQLLQRLRDEAHRFGVAYHRQLRGKAMTDA
jgi:excinuclease ABC subunit C